MKSILVLELCAFFPHFEAQAFIPVEHLHSIIFGDCRVYWTSMIGKKNMAVVSKNRGVVFTPQNGWMIYKWKTL